MKKRTLLLFTLLIAGITFVFVYRYYNHESRSTSLTVSEKKWIEENKSTSIDIEVINDYPIFGMNGTGVFYDFLKDMANDIKLEANEIPYLKTSTTSTDGLRFRIVKSDEKTTEDDLLLFKDYYIAVGKEYRRINRIVDMADITFGIFEGDVENISYHLKSAKNISYKTYTTIDDLYKALENNEVGMIIVPNMMYIDNVISKNYSINYYFTEITNKIVLTLSNNEQLNKIIKKYYKKWLETKFVEEYDKEYFNYYISLSNTSSKEKATFVSKEYVYGYIDNPPYETKVNSKVSGIAGEYLNRISRFAGIDFKYKKYKNKKALEKAIKNKKVDVYFDYYGINNDNYKPTLSTFIEEYVVLGVNSDNYIVNSFESLKGLDIVMIEDNLLYNYVSSNIDANIKKCSTINELVRNSKNKVIVVDKNIYNYYSKTKFSNFIVLYTDIMMNDYRFMVKSDNVSFYNLVNYVINTNSYYNYRNSGLDSLSESFLTSKSFQQVYITVLLLIFIPLIILLIFIKGMKKRTVNKKIVIEDRHKYTDVLTSLKNRNYLNLKIKEWEDSNVYPQAVVVIDLNNVKYVNDNYGHAEGDQLIIEAAGKLVNTQLENSEIMRTDGNEFLVYLIGYSETQVSTYVKKLSKEMKKLPYEFGAGVGYSMILDKIKTLDDAINEATICMTKDKEESK